MISTIIYKIKKKKYWFFFTKLLVFILMLVILDFVIGNILEHFYFKQSSGFLYRTTYSIENTNEEILVFGSSRAIHHYSSEILEKELDMSCYNVGAGGQSIFYHYALLKSILKRYSPKIVILDLKYGEFIPGIADYDKISELLPYYKKHKEIRSIVEYKSQFERLKLLSKIYPYNSLIFKIIIANFEFNKDRNETENDIKGFVPLTRVWNEPIKLDSSYVSKEIDSLKLGCFENFIKDCKKQGIQLFIFVSPYYILTDYPDSSIDIGQNLAQKYDVEFFNYSKDTLFTTNCTLFSDDSHLNGNGANLFTSKIAKILKQE